MPLWHPEFDLERFEMELETFYGFGQWVTTEKSPLERNVKGTTSTI